MLRHGKPGTLHQGCSANKGQALSPRAKPAAVCPCPLSWHTWCLLRLTQWKKSSSQEDWGFFDTHSGGLAGFPVRVGEAGKITHYDFIDIHFTLQMTRMVLTGCLNGPG